MTQHYVGTKIIEAWPQERDGVSGYAVKYSDGYTSWSPADTFESTYIPLGHIGSLKPHEQRMVAELADLDRKLMRLCAFLESPEFQKIGDHDRHDMELQANCMRAYANVLTARVDRIR